MKRAGPAIFATVFVLICAVAAYRIIKSGGAAQKEEEHHEEPAPVSVDTVRVAWSPANEEAIVRGIVRPAPNGESKVAAQLAGRIESVAVKPGQRVSRGQLLAVISRSDVEAAARQAQAASEEAKWEQEARRLDVTAQKRSVAAQIAHAEARLRTAESGLALVKAGPRQEEIHRAEEAVRTQRADLDRLRAGARPQEIAQAAAAVREAQAVFNEKKKSAARKRALAEKGIVAIREAELAEAERDSAEATLQAKQEALDLLKAGNRPEEIRGQESKVREAEAYLQQLRRGARPEELAQAQSERDAARADLNQALSTKSDLIASEQRARSAASKADAARQAAIGAVAIAGRLRITSPLDGVVTQVPISAGDGVAEQTTIAVVLNPRALRAVLEVPVEQRNSAAPGSSVEITSNATPGMKIAGTIAELVPSTEGETGLLTAVVQLPFRPGLVNGVPVNAKLKGRASGRALTVPATAVFAREGETFVYRVEEKKIKEQAVEIGRQLGDRFEVRGGLKAGAVVVKDGSLSLAPDTPVESK